MIIFTSASFEHASDDFSFSSLRMSLFLFQRKIRKKIKKYAQQGCKTKEKRFKYTQSLCSLQTARITSEQKKTNVTPVHIKDSMEPNENYRPISLLCIISKDLESCVRITLNNHVKQFIIPLQHDGKSLLHYTAAIFLCLQSKRGQKYSNRSYLPGLG